MMKYKKIILFFFSIALFGWFFGGAGRQQAKADNTSPSFWTNGAFINISYYENIQGIGTNQRDFILEQLPGIFTIGPYQSFIIIPMDITSVYPADPITNANADGWQDVYILYSSSSAYFSSQSDSTNAQHALASANYIQDAIKNFLYPPAPVAPPTPAPILPNSVVSDPPTIIVGKSPPQTVTITGYFGNYVKEPNKYCYLFIGDGQGKFGPKSSPILPSTDPAHPESLGECSFPNVWTPDTGTFVGSHTIYVTFQNTDSWPGHSGTFTLDSLPFDTSGGASNVINVCASGSTSCTDVSNTGHGGGLNINGERSTAVTLNSSPNPTLTVYISDPLKATEYARAGKKCYFYRSGDATTPWILKGSSDIKDGSANNLGQPNCTFSWNFSGTDPGTYTFIDNILDGGLANPTGDQSASQNTVSVTVCAAGATDCQPAGQNGGGGGGSGGSSGTFDATVNIGDTIVDYLGNTFKLSAKVDTPEHIFELIIKIASDFIGVLAFIATIVGGILVMTSGGDQTKATKGKKSIIYGLIGIVVAVLANSLVTYVIDLLK